MSGWRQFSRQFFNNQPGNPHPVFPLAFGILIGELFQKKYKCS